MKKVLQQGAVWIFAIFAIAVFGLMISLTYQALQRIFPTRFDNQIWGLVLFDIAAVVWAITFIFHSKSTPQYAAAGIGFLTGLLGTLGMIAAEVTLGSNLVAADTQQIGQWLLWGFIGATALHLILIYVHHFGAPELTEQINVGIARGEITTEAVRQATQGLEETKAQLAQSIAQGIKEQVMRDLNLPILADPRMPIIPAQPYEQAIPHPTIDPRHAELTNENNRMRSAITNALAKVDDMKEYISTMFGQPTTTPPTPPKDEFAWLEELALQNQADPKQKDEAPQPKPPFRGSPSE